MRSRFTRKAGAASKLRIQRRKQYLEIYRTFSSQCNACIKFIARPCIKLASRRKKLQRRALRAIALLVSMQLSLARRRASVREHLRIKRLAHELDVYWLHGTDPRTDYVCP